MLIIGSLLPMSIFAGYEGPMPAPGGSSSLFELHVIKNDGMDSHIKWRCEDIDSCYEALNELRYRNPKLESCKSVWFERFDQKLNIK